MSAVTIQILDGRFYWVKRRYGDDPAQWIVARFECGCFRDTSGKELQPSHIHGPLIPPTDPAPEGDEE